MGRSIRWNGLIYKWSAGRFASHTRAHGVIFCVLPNIYHIHLITTSCPANLAFPEEMKQTDVKVQADSTRELCIVIAVPLCNSAANIPSGLPPNSIIVSLSFIELVGPTISGRADRTRKEGENNSRIACLLFPLSSPPKRLRCIKHGPQIHNSSGQGLRAFSARHVIMTDYHVHPCLPEQRSDEMVLIMMTSCSSLPSPLFTHMNMGHHTKCSQKCSPLSIHENLSGPTGPANELIAVVPHEKNSPVVLHSRENDIKCGSIIVFHLFIALFLKAQSSTS